MWVINIIYIMHVVVMVQLYRVVAYVCGCDVDGVLARSVTASHSMHVNNRI
jgi:hypothetical protein